MTTQHTSSPWTNWRDAGKNARMVLISDAIPNALSYATVCGPDRHANQANARLIAAAPDLLAALEELCLAPNKHRPDEYWEAARAAIAKAKGT